jgi:hypothetical protein
VGWEKEKKRKTRNKKIKLPMEPKIIDRSMIPGRVEIKIKR